MNSAKIQNAVTTILEEIGEDPTREGLKKTPVRVARFWEEATAGYGADPQKLVTVFDGEEYDEMILCKDIEFYSLCEHHLLPIIGTAHVGYLPKQKIIGISKLPRVVDIFSKRLQNQERLTMQIADTINELLQPKGVGVIISAKHLCMCARGVKKQNAVMQTSALRGLFKTDARTRMEFLQMTQ